MRPQDHETDVDDALAPPRRFMAEVDALGPDGVTVLVVELIDHNELLGVLGLARTEAIIGSLLARLRASLRGDLLCRISGDRIAVATRAPWRADLLLEILADPVWSAEHEIRIGVSVGCATAPQDGATADDLLRAAALAAGIGRGCGGGCIVVHTQAMSDAAARRRAIESALRTGRVDRHLDVAYQPRLDLRSGRAAGVEALLRWRHPTLGPIAPGEFIPALEAARRAVEVGEWLADRALSDRRLWGDAAARLSVSINLCQSELTGPRPDLAARLAAACAIHRTDPARLELEVTERVVADAAVQAQLDRLAEAGHPIAIDDFGRDRSSLWALSALPARVLKLDQDLTRGVLASPRRQIVLRHAVAVGHALGMKVVAEGVEDADSFDFVAGLGVEEIQGFYYARPMSGASLVRFLAEQTGSA